MSNMLPGARVLIVEDELAMRTALRDILDWRGIAYKQLPTECWDWNRRWNKSPMCCCWMSCCRASTDMRYAPSCAGYRWIYRC